MDIPVWLLRAIGGYRSNAVWQHDFTKKLNGLTTADPERFTTTVTAAGARRGGAVQRRVKRAAELASELGYLLEATAYNGPHAVLTFRRSSETTPT